MFKRIACFFTCFLAFTSMVVARPSDTSTIQQSLQHFYSYKDAWLEMQESFLHLLRQDSGIHVGVFIEDLKHGYTFSINDDDTFSAASMIKLGVMAAVFQAVNDSLVRWDETITYLRKDRVGGSGKLKYQHLGSRWDIKTLVNMMITVSDNIATNMLVRRLGASYINEVLQRYGFQVMRYRRPIMNLRLRDKGLINPISPREVGRFYEMLYRGQLVSAASSREMLSILLQQTRNTRLPRGFSSGVRIAHKTGTFYNVAHDGGIVYLRDSALIVCVSTSFHKGSLPRAEQLITRIGKILSEHL